MILPSEPGLLRRLAYSNHIRNRNRSRYNYNSNNTNNHFSSLSITSYSFWPDESEWKPVQNGLSIDQLRLVSKINIELDPFICPICQDENSDKYFICRTLICDHTFHICCIEKWLSDNTTCPMCRYDFSNCI
jgi:hypothetical protein